jgi:moderate conductance mechanosensitive channel
MSAGTFLAVGTVEWLRTHGVRIVALVLAAFVVSRLGRLAVHRVERRMRAAPDRERELELQRIATVTNILTNALMIVVWTVVVLLVLGELNINLAPLIAGAGIAGVALGFGAQSLVRDALMGFFILFEDQLRVGDEVVLSTTGGQITGVIEELTLRMTAIRAPDGVLSTVSNGNINLVSNRSRAPQPPPPPVVRP